MCLSGIILPITKVIGCVKNLNGRSCRKYYLVNVALRRDKFKLESNLNTRQLVRAYLGCECNFDDAQIQHSPTLKRANSKARSAEAFDSTKQILHSAHVPTRKSPVYQEHEIKIAQWKKFKNFRNYALLACNVYPYKKK